MRHPVGVILFCNSKQNLGELFLWLCFSTLVFPHIKYFNYRPTSQHKRRHIKFPEFCYKHTFSLVLKFKETTSIWLCFNLIIFKIINTGEVLKMGIFKQLMLRIENRKCIHIHNFANTVYNFRMALPTGNLQYYMTWNFL